MNPLATAESIENPATETINDRFPAMAETIKRTATETIKKRFLRRPKPYNNQRRKQ